MTVTSAGDYTGSVTIPETFIYDGVTYSVTAIGIDAFRDCSGLTAVTIPNSVETIENNVFRDCSGLTAVTIGKSVATIAGRAFGNCSSLTDVYCYAETVPATVLTAFAGVSLSKATLYVPASALEDYETTPPWNGFGTFKAIEDVTGVKSVDAAGNSGSLPDGKYLKGGRLVIVKGGKEYDAAGAVK